MNSERTEFIRAQMSYLESNRDSLTIDADTHISDPNGIQSETVSRASQTPNYYHGRPIDAESLRATMRLSGVDLCLSWQNPAATAYTSDPAVNYERLLAANQYVAQTAWKYPQSFVPAGWTDPKALGVAKAVALADHCVNELGMAIVKLNPAQNEFPIDGPEACEVVDAIVANGAIVAFHFGADTPYTPAEGLRNIARRHQEVPFIAVHMGGGGAAFTDAEQLYTDARQLGIEQENLFFVLSAKRDAHMESDFITYQHAGRTSAQRLMCGSDAPYANQAFQFGGFRGMLNAFVSGAEYPDRRLNEKQTLFDRAAVQGYLGGNFARLMVRTYKRLLQHQQP